MSEITPENLSTQESEERGATIVGEDWKYTHEIKELAEKLPNEVVVTKEAPIAALEVAKGTDIVFIVDEHYKTYVRVTPTGDIFEYNNPKSDEEIEEFDGFDYKRKFTADTVEPNSFTKYVLNAAKQIQLYLEAVPESRKYIGDNKDLIEIADILIKADVIKNTRAGSKSR